MRQKRYWNAKRDGEKRSSFESAPPCFDDVRYAGKPHIFPPRFARSFAGSATPTTICMNAYASKIPFMASTHSRKSMTETAGASFEVAHYLGVNEGCPPIPG
ncbi:hypothetical protein KCP71_07570 [Salmonella enterica subsp. enterica]|nr:hypothetical protein KCP71_07570 [Salmonella enterica subsp. enterica]